MWRLLAASDRIPCSYATTYQDDIVFDQVTEEIFTDSLMGKTVVSAKRKGKYLWFKLDSGPDVVFHFGMTGAFVVCGKHAVTYRR